MNLCQGSGILGLPYAMAQMGILSFFIICGSVAGLAYYAILLMLDLCKQTGAKVSVYYFTNSRLSEYCALLLSQVRSN